MGHSVDWGKILTEYGPMGLGLLAMGYIIVTQYKDNKALTKQLLEQAEQRRVEGLETAKALTDTMQSFSQSTSMLVDKIKIVQK